MTTRRHNHLALAAASISLLVACAPATTPDPNGIFVLGQVENSLEAHIQNHGRAPIVLDNKFALSGLAGDGNIQLIPISEDGTRHSVCSYIDSSVDHSASTNLRSGEIIKIELGSIEAISKLYCLPNGGYFVSILYFDGRGNQFLSNVIKIQVNGTGSGSLPDK